MSVKWFENKDEFPDQDEDQINIHKEGYKRGRVHI